MSRFENLINFCENEVHLRYHEGQLQCNFFTNTVHIMNRPLDESIYKTCNRLYLGLEKAKKGGKGKGKGKKGGDNNTNATGRSASGVEFSMCIDGQWEVLEPSSLLSNESPFGWQRVQSLRFAGR